MALLKVLSNSFREWEILIIIYKISSPTWSKLNLKVVSKVTSMILKVRNLVLKIR
jgi:hypothetical protein